MSWYFFAATNYFLYGESLIYYFKHILTLQASFLPTAFSFAQHHRLISFGLHIVGFVSFVADLTRAQLRRQFGLFGWIHMSLLLTVVIKDFGDSIPGLALPFATSLGQAQTEELGRDGEGTS